MPRAALAGRRVILFLSRLDPKKNLETVIDAVAASPTLRGLLRAVHRRNRRARVRRAFHGIATGLRRGHDPAVVQDLLAPGLLQGDAAACSVPGPVAEQQADWVERTAAVIGADLGAATPS